MVLFSFLFSGQFFFVWQVVLLTSHLYPFGSDVSVCRELSNHGKVAVSLNRLIQNLGLIFLADIWPFLFESKPFFLSSVKQSLDCIDYYYYFLWYALLLASR